MFDGARKILDVCAGLKRGENVVIVTDTDMVAVPELLAKTARKMGGEVVTVTMSPRKTHGEEPPKPVAAAMKNADLILAPTSFSIAHTNARIDACKSGARQINLPRITMDALSGGALEADFLKIVPIGQIVEKKISEAKEANVTTPGGTSIWMELGRKAVGRYCLARESGAFASVPIVEVFVSPIEGTANGTIVVDGSVLVPEIGLLSNPIKLIVEKGYVTKIEGKEEASKFRQILQRLNDPQVYNIAELAIPLNPKAKITGRFWEDEGVYGTCHMAMGSNFTQGGKIKAVAHIDLTMMRPTIKLDANDLMIDGKVKEMEKFLQRT